MESPSAVEHLAIPADHSEALLADEIIDMEGLIRVIWAIRLGTGVLFPRRGTHDFKMLFAIDLFTSLTDCLQLFGGAHGVA